MTLKKQLIGLGLLALLLFACKPTDEVKNVAVFDDYAFLENNIKTLASDDFMGREPFTEGEELTVDFLAKVYQEIGLKPVFGDSYFQEVPCVSVVYDTDDEINLETQGGTIALKKDVDYIAQTPHLQEKVSLDDSELVFAGYGIVAPEYGWNDYEGLDVKGKTVLVLVNDPGFATGDEDLFRGKAMTYYGRWTYKYEEAARQGAAGVMVIHNTDAAGYEFKVLTNTAGSNIYLEKDNKNKDLCTLTGWITEDATSRLFEANGLDFNKFKNDALKSNFKPMNLATTISLDFENDLTYQNTRNVVGMIEGSQRPEENIVYTAHWDHFGYGPVADNDSIYNGAADNATALAAMLQTAKAFVGSEQPERSVVFAAVTAEESGLMGSAYYAQHNPFPTEKTVANLNFELLLPMGRMKDVMVTGFGMSELEKYVEEEAAKQDRYVVAEATPENGMYYRSDHFSFARVGIPSLFIKGWQDSREYGKEWAEEKVKEYWATKYHKPADEYDPDTADLTGIMEDAQLFYQIGERLANENTFPKWYDGSEFKNIREESMN
ncbi:M28 family peptidase [Flavobacteriaceae bacterium Ap0902]|nr:M28 family peptidase [Flavobacteriaceae bacterium Ap0902]